MEPLLDPVFVFTLFVLRGVLGCAGVAEAYPVWTLLQHYCPALAPSPPPPPPPVVPGRYSVAVVSSLLGHSQSLAMTTSAMVQGLRTQPGLTLTLYYFPGQPPFPYLRTAAGPLILCSLSLCVVQARRCRPR